MKNKPGRHKEKNTFQFKPFSVRINEIDVDIFHRVSHRNEENYDSVETHFHSTLEKWNVLNLTDGYCEFKKNVQHICTLPQLLNEKDFVIDSLFENLRKKDVLFLQPILELVVAVARDLQKDFYEYFPKFLEITFELLQTKDVEQLEYAFTALAYSFKFLWRYLVKNIQSIFELLLPLLEDTQPVYINNFAAESFAFVVRKVKHKESFLKLILQALEKEPRGIAGCGRLLFEVVSGTQGQLHSCAEQMLSLYLRALQDVSINQCLLYDVLQTIVNHLVQTIHPIKSNLLWRVLLNVIDEYIMGNSIEMIEGREHNIVLVLRLLSIIVNYKEGKMLSDPIPVTKRLLHTIDVFKSEIQILKACVDTSIAILLAANVKLTHETSARLLRSVMSVDVAEIVHSAVHNLIHHPLFETLMLPDLLRYHASTKLEDEILQLYARIIKEKAPPCLCGNDLQKWKKYVIHFHNLNPENIDRFLQKLNTLWTGTVSVDALRILIILPHIEPLPAQIKDQLKVGIVKMYNKILSDQELSDTEDTETLSFALLLTLDAIIHILSHNELHHLVKESNINFLDFVSKHKDNIIVLNMFDLYLTNFSNTEYHNLYLSERVFESLNNNLVQKLSSPIQQVRFVVTHIYSLFVHIGTNAMELVHLAECKPATVQCYRDKLLHLDALAGQSQAVATLDLKYHEFPLRYLIGNLYTNFSLLWEPVSKLIASYADKEYSHFWKIFYSELTSLTVSDIGHKPIVNCRVITELQEQLQEIKDKPDYENQRILMWKCMLEFPQLCEMQNKDLVGLFIDYVNNQFFKSNSEDAKSFNIEKVTTLEVADNDENSSDSENEEKDEADEMPQSKTSAIPQCLEIRTYKTKVLLAQLELFGKMTNSRMLFREREIYKIYLDLLTSKNAEIQKAALTCIFTFKHKYLLLYKEYLYNLINEKSLKKELIRFKIDKESGMVNENDRAGLMQILMRILYGKLITKVGMRTGNRSDRRKNILRFLAGAQEDEMISFIELALKPLQKYASILLHKKVNVDIAIKDIIESVNLSAVVPPRRMQSTANLLGIIIEQFGGKMNTKLLPYLLGMLLCILAEIAGIFQKSSIVHTTYLSSIKKVRKSCISILARFFSHFEDYTWTQYELDALYNVAVFPLLEKLPIDGIHSPTALLQLFMSWGENPRYYSLFLMYPKDDTAMAPLSYITKLLLNDKTHPSVVTAILEMFEKMLTLENYKPGGNSTGTELSDYGPFLSLSPLLNNLRNVDVKSYSSKGINYGSAILLPHVPEILQYIKTKFEKSSKNVNKVELRILSRISEFATDSHVCNMLLTMVLPILEKSALHSTNESYIMELITTVINLIKNVKAPEIHLRSIVPLFGIISPIPARKLLLQLYYTLVEKSSLELQECFMKNYELLDALNAWNQKWIEQPDFERRLPAFSQIIGLAEQQQMTLEFGVCIIYNCFFFLKNETDLAMIDYSIQCLKELARRLVIKYKNDPSSRRYLIDDTILTIIKKGINSKQEPLRLRSIALLGHMAAECSDAHVVLHDLALLVDKVDPEVDFFENMQHLQLHRRARALLKFCNVCKKLNKPMHPRTLMQFILPLASMYLCNESYIKKNSLIDAAIEAIGTICRLLPWYHYEKILKFYLNKLKASTEYQRQLVRVVVIILNAFHYDLSKYKPQEATELRTNAKLQCNVEDVLREKGEEENDKIAADGNIEESIEDILNDVPNTDNYNNAKDEMEETQTEVEHNKCVPIMEQQILLSENAAKRIIYSITKALLPQLHRTIIAKTIRDATHKVNRKRMSLESEEEDLTRIPIALAFVKLLQKLPEGTLDANLPGILIKLCTFLKSRLESVRRTTRQTFQKIMTTLGPKYLHYLLREMNALLTRGFQVHVLVYTVHSVLVTLKPDFQKFDVDRNLQSILHVCKIDLFGLSAEEKEVVGIVRNVSEAKSTKSLDIFRILAEKISESCLLDLILPLKEVLIKTHSHKTMQKIVECFRNIVLGLADNKYIPVDRMLIFLYGVISESIPELLPTKKVEQTVNISISQKSDCFIIPPRPKNRMGIKTAAKTSRSTNIHVIVEFGLKLCHILLKREKIYIDLKSYLDPFVPVLADCIKSQHVKLTTLAIQCLSWTLKVELDSAQTLISHICSSMFEILHKYAAVGLSKGENFDLVMATFKCMAVLIRDVKYFTITTEQLKVLIVYAEQDLHDGERQATAFTLLKAIISRKLIVDEMYTAMEKVGSLSVRSELEHVRVQARSVFYSYFMQYPLGKRLNTHITFFLSQLSYEMQPGRLSALEMIHNIITGFPLKTLVQESGHMFLSIGARLINDSDPTCRKLCAKCIKEMIIRLSHNERKKLFDIIILWLQDSAVQHRTLATQICGIFVLIEKDAFEVHLKTIWPLLLKQFYDDFRYENESKPGRFVLLQKHEYNTNTEIYSQIKDMDRLKDHHLFQVLQLILKLSANCASFLKSDDYKESIVLLAGHSQSLLSHPHLWVRLAVAQLLGFILAASNNDGSMRLWTVFGNDDNVVDSKEDNSVHFVGTLKSLILDLIAQLQPDMTFEELANQVIKNLIFIARNLLVTETIEVAKNEKCNLSLLWLTKRLRKAVNIEIIQAPKSISVRTAVFKWIAGVVATVPLEQLNKIVMNIMSPLVREMTTTEESVVTLRQLAKQVATVIKKKIGVEEYSNILIKVQQKLDIKKAERRKLRTRQFVTDPELAAKRKITKQKKKKEARKRKLTDVRGKKIKRPRKEIDLDDL